MRYTPSRPSVKSTRLRRSETVKRFFRLSMASPDGKHSSSRDCLCRAARGQDLLRRFSAELVRAHGQRLADLAARQHLDRPIRAVNEPVLAQELRRHERAGVELRRERVEVHHLVLNAEGIVKAALRHAPMERHLAALEAALELEPRSRFRALVAAARRLALSRPLTAADSLLRVGRAGR